MVWLPGAYQTAQDFLTAGFAAAVRRRQASLDLLFVDMEFAYLGDRAALQLLRSDIVLPARTAGVSIWLGGISLGGLTALDYAASCPEEIDGLCLLAPYLGNRILTAEIARAPGLAAWQPGELAQIDE
jgi:alpha-beta hydrolase superfamily lysophospholipase